MKTYEEVKKERDWIGRQVDHLEEQLNDRTRWTWDSPGKEVIREALHQAKIQYAIAEAAAYTHRD